MNKCVVVVDRNLPIGRAANAAAVVALTIGERHPALVGPELTDKSGFNHPGLIPIGIAILAADCEDLRCIRQSALSHGCDVVDLPTTGQLTTDYEHFRQQVLMTSPEELDYVAVGMLGPKPVVSKIVGSLGLLK